MREFAILVQLILLRPATGAAGSTPAIGLIAPVADLQGQVSLSGAAVWLSQHLPGGLALLLPLMVALMLQVRIRRRSPPAAAALSRGGAPVAPGPANRFAPGMARATKEEHAASAPVI